MADNVAITPGTGATVAADEVVDGTLGTVKVQYVKLMDGTLDGTTKATVNATGLKVDASGAAVPVTNLDVALSTRLKPADTLAAVTNLAQLGGVAPVLTAASTAAAAADRALVVAVSPNSPVAQAPATLVVTAVSGANATVTCTLPAAGAGLFHYISRIIIERVATTAIAGTAVLTYTSTNLPGSWARTTGNAAPVGQQMKDVDEVLSNELKSSAANTATTIVAPAAGATGIVRITVYYRTAA